MVVNPMMLGKRNIHSEGTMLNLLKYVYVVSSVHMTPLPLSHFVDTFLFFFQFRLSQYKAGEIGFIQGKIIETNHSIFATDDEPSPDEFKLVVQYHTALTTAITKALESVGHDEYNHCLVENVCPTILTDR